MYYFSEGPVAFEFPPIVVTNEYMNNQYWNIDKGNANTVNYDFQVYINGTILTMGRQQYFWFTANNTHLTIDAPEGIDQMANIDIRVVSQDPYYYMDPYTRAVTGAKIDLYLPNFLNV